MPYSLALRAYRFVRGDGSLTITVALIALFLFALYPMAEVGVVRTWWLDVAFAICLVAGAMLVSEPRQVRNVVLALVATTVVLRLAESYDRSLAIVTLDAAFVIATAFALGVLVLARSTRDGRINIHRILGACGTFLLLGLVFSQGYRLLALYIPDAFAIEGRRVGTADLQHAFTYYSFVTLTSTGYGDIVPVHPYARSLAMFEAVTGQLYLAVLIARLVGLEMEWRETQREAQAGE
ncbi:hypothetical protein BURK1_02579 [Burkholderiales bacterium]|nr:hypothetical protein BURK1_02579 [Burkholderiales bacterium]